ncbi:MAG TPA: ABC transporter permease [Candidatus Desulfobacillus denitrificans]|nr:ABC transporter permease [Candidatus Desulfobacillus denitrificans]
MTATRWLLAYLAAVVAVTFIHEAWLLAALLAAALAAGGAGRWRIARRAVLAVLTFNLTVSLGYAAVSLWQGRFSAAYLLVNLRVVLLVYLGFWFVARVNLLDACRFSPTLSFVVTLAAGQIEAFARALRDFRLAFASRNAAAPALAARARHAAAQAGHLLDKSVCMAAETALAMRSRGCFDDHAGLPPPQAPPAACKKP